MEVKNFMEKVVERKLKELIEKAIKLNMGGYLEDRKKTESDNLYFNLLNKWL